MQETVPQLEEELEKIVTNFVENAAKARSPEFVEVPRCRIFEGHQSTIVRTSGEEEEIDFKEFSSVSEISSEIILYSDINTIFDSFLPVAEGIASEQEKMFFEILNQATQKTGNVIDAEGEKFSPEMILEALEKIQIDFDAEGNPRLPQLVVGSAVYERIKQLINEPAQREFEEETGIHDYVIDEDAPTFVEKEIRRGNKYHGIIMDPPIFGLGPKGGRWKLNRDLPELIENVMKLLDVENRFFIMNTYSPQLPLNDLKKILHSVPGFPTNFEATTLGLKSTAGKELPLGNLVRF